VLTHRIDGFGASAAQRFQFRSDAICSAILLLIQALRICMLDHFPFCMNPYTICCVGFYFFFSCFGVVSLVSRSQYRIEKVCTAEA
jgi:hypothetical protein